MGNVLIAGVLGIDTITNCNGTVRNVLGGPVPFAALAASFFASPSVVSAAGTDLTPAHLLPFKKRKIDLSSVQRREGKTFHWEASYDKDFKNAFTIRTDLNVFEGFHPVLTAAQKKCDAVFLANMDPGLQLSVLNQMERPRLVTCDSMNFWITNRRAALLKLIKKVDVFFVSEEEARQLTGEYNLIKAGKKILKMGPGHVVIKLGPNGVMLVSPLGLLQLPPRLVEEIKDTTGAGDTFGGAFTGFLSGLSKWETLPNIKKALLMGTVLASFNIESFSAARLAELSKREIDKRAKDYCLNLKF